MMPNVDKSVWRGKMKEYFSATIREVYSKIIQLEKLFAEHLKS